MSLPLAGLWALFLWLVWNVQTERERTRKQIDDLSYRLRKLERDE